jgi:hypothetical protein
LPHLSPDLPAVWYICKITAYTTTEDCFYPTSADDKTTPNTTLSFVNDYLKDKTNTFFNIAISFVSGFETFSG